ncbi:hypothetical protein EJ07DRAFT_172180 [Lizonia empirigonia]|nr:hypothetical protein EJ07DRAFT_172180 [Lizonia empirigonia]
MTALQFDSHSFVDSNSPDGYDFGLGFDIGSFDPSFHNGALGLSTGGVQASEATHRILDFEGLGLEEVVDFVAPDHTKIELAYTTYDAAIQGVNDDFRNDKMYWESPKPDISIPQTQAHRQEIVRVLLAAMKDPSKAVDHQMRSFKKRWAADAPNRYSDSIMEATCWKIAELSERLHVEGPTVLCVATENAMATNKDSASLTFGERIRYLVVILTQFKARCENLIKGTFLHTVVGNPKQALKDSHLNARVNPRRQECLAFAHEHMAEDKAIKRKRHNHLKAASSTEEDFDNITANGIADSDEHESTLSSLNNDSRKRLRASSEKGP